MRLVFSPAATLVLLMLGASCELPTPRLPTIPPGDYGTLTQQLDARAARSIQSGTQALGITVVAGDDVVYRRSHGEVREGVPADAHTVYRVASVSKLFTSIAVMQLVERGLIDLDAPLADQLNGFSIKSRFPDAVPVTPRLMLSHRAGLPSDRIKGMFSHAPSNWRTDLEYLREEHLGSPPGSVYSYSNFGMTLLGLLIEQVSGEDYAQYVQRHILQPLQMNDSSMVPDEALLARMPQGRARGTAMDEGGIGQTPAAGLHTTPHDMGQFLRGLLAMLRASDDATGLLLNPRTFREMVRAQNEGKGLDLDRRVGLGFHLREHAGLGDQLAFHQGATPCFRALLLLDLAEDVGVFTVSNTVEAAQDVNQIAEDALELAVETRSGRRVAPMPPLPPPALLSPPGRAHDWAGRYATPEGVLELVPQANGFAMTAAGQAMQLVPAVGGDYLINAPLGGVLPFFIPGMRMRLEEVQGQKVVGVDVGRGWELYGVRLEPSEIPASWRNRVGTWRPVDGDADVLGVERVEIVEDRGLLIARATMKEWLSANVVLRALDDDHAMLEGYGRNLGEVIRAIHDGSGDAELAWLGYRLRRVQ